MGVGASVTARGWYTKPVQDKMSVNAYRLVRDDRKGKSPWPGCPKFSVRQEESGKTLKVYRGKIFVYDARGGRHWIPFARAVHAGLSTADDALNIDAIVAAGTTTTPSEGGGEKNDKNNDESSCFSTSSFDDGGLHHTNRNTQKNK